MSEMKKLLLSLLFACSCACANAQVAQLAQADQQEIAGVITRMFAALQRGDIESVFALQTEDTRNTYKTADQFAAELKKCCTALHEAVTEVVVSTAESGNGITAFVLMIDHDDDRWSAQFIMEKHTVWQIDQIHIKLIDEPGREQMKL
jgi:hypothetical protein